MDYNKTDDVLNDATGGTAKADIRRQALKYVFIWLAIVGLFLVFNTVIKSVAATRSAAEAGSYGGYYGQSAGYYDQAGGGSGGCGGDCCGTGDQVAGGGASGSAGQIDTSDPKQVEKAAIDWYAQKTGDRDVTAEVENLGCHQEITIKKDGKAVSELSLRNGQFTSLTPW